MMTDPIADMLTRIRNASMARKKEVVLPFSKIKLAIAELLVKNDYLQSAVKKEDGIHPYILVNLKFVNKQPVIQHIKRVSKPGKRVYVKCEEIKQVLNGFGISLISTPKGVMTNKQARADKLGGELICEIY
ncbi:MAG: 30S ribosomal protein S8 [Candidatus Magasanikbacteria bacterium CG10_big_fil_rev_8_21_14_0_10_40_10]|uniref:Small ribosomal subunit protein uS8 n=1 Tax=Candidatus Magasanikbacteria bacterium CG10_big_fil_rev_8_21_14_0_10_40_10 TaxID=1974648 RepID=A0A2M6W579_9BACT|nr:MAG: 30S ribosomal protein S8 [Candidatus Magasanikbacteria bacterium CG10_big_fil_rev_8_21_14_0_10_40_10]